MLLTLTDLSDESLQSQIVRQLRAKILRGELDPDSSLPSIRALARNQRVSVITVQRAYEALAREDLIHSRRGKGFFVSRIHERKKAEMSIERLMENLRPVVRAALEEGLAVQEILAAVRKILEKEARHGQSI